jgi:hypothetical protein
MNTRMQLSQPRKLPPLSYFREHAKMVIGGFLAVAITAYLLLPFIWQPKQTNTILDRYAETPVRVGDSRSAVDNREVAPHSSIEKDGETTVLFQSKKAPKSTFRFVLNTKGRVVEAEYPVGLQEKVTMSTIGNLLPTAESLEYWDTESPSTKILFYPTLGFAVRFHESTRSVYTLYQFVPNGSEAFLRRNPQFVEKQPEAEVDPDQTAPTPDDAFDTSVEIPNLDETPFPTAKPKSDIDKELFLSR